MAFRPSTRSMSPRLARAPLVLLALLALLMPTACTIVPIAEIEQARASEQFSAVAFVDNIWAEQLLPTFTEQAHPLEQVLDALEEDLEGAAGQYGLSVGGAYNFMVRGAGEVTAVNTESRNGLMTVALDGYSGPTEVLIQIGPLVRGNAIRDAAGFIGFGQFRDQTEFGQVSKELNSRVSRDVLAGLDPATLAGKRVSFVGAFTISVMNQTNIDLSQITVTPVELTVEG